MVKRSAVAFDDSMPDLGTLPALPRQRSRRVMILGAVLTALGIIVGWSAFSSAADRSPVVVAVRDVPAGREVTQADVGTAMVSADPKVATIPASQMNEVVGRIAGADLRRGVLVSPAQLKGEGSPGAGQQLVPIALKRAQLPARGLEPGVDVLVIATPGGQGQTQQTPPSDSRPALTSEVQAKVDRVSGPDADGMMTVDLIVSASAGPQISRQASTGHLAVVVLPRRP